MEKGSNSNMVGIWLPKKDQYMSGDFELINSNFDIVMLAHGWIDNTDIYDKFSIKKWIHLGFTYRPEGMNRDYTAVRVSKKCIERHGNDSEFYIDEPYTKAKEYQVRDVNEILGEYDNMLIHKFDKRLRYGEGQRWYDNKKYGLTAWTYYTDWFKTFWWFPLNFGKFRLGDWLGLVGERNIRHLAKHGLSHIWVHADRLWQLPKLKKLAHLYNIPLFLYIPSRYDKEGIIKRAKNFIDAL